MSSTWLQNYKSPFAGASSWPWNRSIKVWEIAISWSVLLKILPITESIVHKSSTKREQKLDESIWLMHGGSLRVFEILMVLSSGKALLSDRLNFRRILGDLQYSLILQTWPQNQVKAWAYMQLPITDWSRCQLDLQVQWQFIDIPWLFDLYGWSAQRVAVVPSALKWWHLINCHVHRTRSIIINQCVSKWQVLIVS